MVTTFNSQRGKSDSPWLVTPAPNPQAPLRLFCFPYAGGSAQIYRTWANSLPVTVEVCAVEIPGRGRRLREKAHENLLTLVADACMALRPYMDKPFAFYGHSMGALISFEFARQLRREGLPLPAHIFMSGRRAPQIPDNPLTYNLPEPEFIAELRRLNGTPQEVLEHPELLQLMLPMLRADFSVCQTYTHTPEPPLKCGFSVYGGIDDVDVKREHLEAWSAHTSSAFAVQMFSGDHFFLHTSTDYLKALSQELHRLVGMIILKTTA